jgi:hypothetical protein
MGDLIPGQIDTLLAKAKALVDAVSFDDSGSMVGGQYQGGNGGLLSRETMKVADTLRLELDLWKKATQKYNLNYNSATFGGESSSGNSGGNQPQSPGPPIRGGCDSTSGKSSATPPAAAAAEPGHG